MTTTVESTLLHFNSLASSSFTSFQKDSQSQNDWIDSFFASISSTSSSTIPVSQLLKTPARSTVKLYPFSSVNRSNNLTAQKDRVATLLFPSSALDKENPNSGVTTSAIQTRISINVPSVTGLREKPNLILSPKLVNSSSSITCKGKGKEKEPQPVEDVFLISSPPPTVPTSISKLIENVDEEGNLSNVVEEDEEDVVMEEVTVSTSTSNAIVVDQEEEDSSIEVDSSIEREAEEQEEVLNDDKTANLSIIGEEEEEEDEEQMPVDPQPLEPTSSLIIPETQLSSHPPPSPKPRPSSIPPEADDQLPPSLLPLEESLVPLNDEPSLLRNAPTTSTPSSSSPLLTFANKTPSSYTNLGRTSAVGGAKLMFVGLPKKSLGFSGGKGALGGNGSWISSASGGGGESQSSTTSVLSSQSQTQSTVPTSNNSTVFDTVGMNNGMKRKSLELHSTAGNKHPKLEGLKEKLAEINNRYSVVGSLANSGVVKPLVGGVKMGVPPPALEELLRSPPMATKVVEQDVIMKSPSRATFHPQQQQPKSPQPLPLPKSTSFFIPQSPPPPQLTRRGSVNDLVKSFENRLGSPPPVPALPLGYQSKRIIGSPAPSRVGGGRLRSPEKTFEGGGGRSSPNGGGGRSYIGSPGQGQGQGMRSPITRSLTMRMLVTSPSRGLEEERGRDRGERENTPPVPSPGSGTGGVSTTPKDTPPTTTTNILSRSVNSNSSYFPGLVVENGRKVGSKEIGGEEVGVGGSEEKDVEMEREEGEEEEEEEEEEDDSEDEDTQIREVGDMLGVSENSLIRFTDESLRISLPGPPPKGSDEEDDEEEEEERVLMIVEKGRGDIVSAWEGTSSSEVNNNPLRKTVRPSESSHGISSSTSSKLLSNASKIVMPGGFGAGDEEDDDDTSSNTTTTTTTCPKGRPGSAMGSFLNRSIGASGVARKVDNSKGVKSIQLAAVAAKKEREEKEKKAAVKEERERRRMVTMQKKQDEEKLKLEEERRTAERKRKERELAAAVVKPPVRTFLKPKDESRPLVKKTTSTAGGPSSTRPFPASSSNSNLNSSLSSSIGRSGPLGHSLKSSTNGGGPSSATSMIGIKHMHQPNGVVGSFSSTSAAPPARVPSVKPPTTGNMYPHPKSTHHHHSQQPQKPIASTSAQPKSEPEQILPDIDSEYSDSDASEHEKKMKEYPHWVKSPITALGRQAHHNPDELFGPMPPLSMKDIFRNAQSVARTSKRTSSAHWEGTDALTEYEMTRYSRQMGYTSTSKWISFVQE